ncbi:MAG: hypothetical protein U1F11_12955 [Steroidobacteraceae bacterium]
MAVPLPDPELQLRELGAALGGELPSPLAPPSGRVFRTRCPHATAACAGELPQFKHVDADRWIACLRWHELPRYERDAAGAAVAGPQRLVADRDPSR